MQRSIPELTRAIAKGDAGALAALYRAWFDALCHHARRETGRDEAFCLDVVQDVFVRVIRSMKPLDSEAALCAWLHKAVRSCAIDRLRREARSARRERSHGRRAERRPEPRSAPSSESLDALDRELSRIGEQGRALLALRIGRGWTLAQVGRALGLSAGAADGRVRRLIEEVRQHAVEAGDV